MDAELLAHIRFLAEEPTSCETPGVPLDFDLDNLIFTARAIVRREERCRQASNDDKPCGGTYSSVSL